MEADKITEEPHTALDAEESLSSKDPSPEDTQEPPIPESPLEPTLSEALLESLASESPVLPSTSQTPLDIHTSETPVEPSTSTAPLEHSASEVPLETLTPETQLETHTPKVLDQPLAFQTSSLSHAPGYPSDNPKEDFSESSSSEGSWVKRPIHTSEFEGSPSQVHLDTFTKVKEEEEEGEREMDATTSNTYAAQPVHQLGKKKGKKGVSRYTIHPVVPAKQADLVDVAKAMHREKFGSQVNYLFQWEKDAALNAIQTGLYIGWRCPHYLWDCFRIGDESKCFCGHLLREHQIISDISVPCNVGQCHCLMFCFIPSRPEEVGEFWLKRRATFDPKAWRAQCRCKHSHEDHTATGSHSCRVKGCCCSCFESNFLCAACDRRWEEHETFFETEETRRRGGRPHGADYVPFAEMPTLREAVINNSDFEALQKQGLSGHPSSHPSPPGLPSPRDVQPSPPSKPRS
nr:protein FAM221B isoform X2 [Odocoileus virginianus texanus]XP_020764607.1 protein FAM221B-like isoform X2 [Odocoileus virginianus texanus]